MADSSSPLDPKELDARLRRAVNDQRAGRLDDAEEAYQALVDHHSAKPQILYLLGTIACQRGRWEDGVTRLRAAIAEQPGFAQAHNDLGGALQNLGRVEPAIIAYTEAIQEQFLVAVEGSG